MTSTALPNRVPAGVSTGGQFATSARAETGVALAAPAAAGSHYVYIEREDSPSLAIGPFPSMDAAVRSMEHSTLVQGLLEEDEGGIECWADDDKVLREYGDDFERVEVDLNDPYDTGEPPLADPDTLVRIEDPEDVFSAPLYEGPAAGAAEVLAAGKYRAVAADDVFTEYTVRVEEAGAP